MDKEQFGVLKKGDRVFLLREQWSLGDRLPVMKLTSEIFDLHSELNMNAARVEGINSSFSSACFYPFTDEGLDQARNMAIAIEGEWLERDLSHLNKKLEKIKTQIEKRKEATRKNTEILNNITL